MAPFVQETQYSGVLGWITDFSRIHLTYTSGLFRACIWHLKVVFGLTWLLNGCAEYAFSSKKCFWVLINIYKYIFYLIDTIDTKDIFEDNFFITALKYGYIFSGFEFGLTCVQFGSVKCWYLLGSVFGWKKSFLGVLGFCIDWNAIFGFSS